MFQGLRNAFKIPELRWKMFITFLLLCIYRIGCHVPTPGVNGKALSEFFETQRQTWLGFFDLFTGGALRRLSVCALGIMPYISASIILQLLTVVVPYLEKLSKEGGEEGRQKITQYTRYGTVLLSMIQSFGISMWLSNPLNFGGKEIVPHPGIGFTLLVMLTLTTGTIFAMWLGERITEKGIGNGISLLIFVGIVARVPADVGNTIRAIRTHQLSLFSLVFLLVVIVLTVAAVVLITQGMRKIPVQYARRVVGRRVYGGRSTYIPLRVNTAGVIPVIFAGAMLMFPATITTFVRAPFLENIKEIFNPYSPLSLHALLPERLQEVFLLKLLKVFNIYNVLYAILIIGFSYFYTAIILNPTDLSENMRKYGGFIPGIRPGKQTSEFIDKILSRITLAGGVYLALIAILPHGLILVANAPFFFGGTSLLIMVGVALDTVKQIESHMLMRQYEGFLKKGKIKARY